MLKKYKSASALKAHVNQCIDAGKLDVALRLIHDYVERIVTEPICTSQVFGSVDLDSLCQAIGKANFKALNCVPKVNSDEYNTKQTITYVVTKLQKSGGHTRVIEDFIKARPNARHVILSTELEGCSDVDYLVSGVAKQVNLAIEQAPRGSYLQRLTWLQKRLFEIKASNNYLFNHHQDSVAVAAILPEMQLKASFYHHGDHHLSLGVHLQHLEHIDPHPMGYHYCRDYLNIENVFIPLIVDDKGERAERGLFEINGHLTTCTVGRSNKIEVPYYVSYVDIVPELLNATKGKHIHIGRLSFWALRKIRKGLRENNIPVENFVYIPWVSSVWKALHDFKVDLYIASFPYGGGLTLIEAMGAGIPVALHKHIFSRVLSGIDLAYPDVFYWDNPKKLLDYCGSMSIEILTDNRRKARAHYINFHQPEILRNTLVNSIYLNAPANIIKDFIPNSDEYAFWVENQITHKKVISRSLYRFLRRIRAYFF